MKNAASLLCMAFVALVWSSAAGAQGYAGVMAPAEGYSDSDVTGIYQFTPSVPESPAEYADVMGGDEAAPVDYKAEEARRREEIRLQNEAAQQERNERLRLMAEEDLKIHEDLQRQKDFEALGR